MTHRRTLILLLAILALGAFLRLYDITADPPNHFAGLGMDLMTDPYHITHFARNAILFGEWDPFGETRWTAFRVSVMSGFSWLVFSLVGVSRLSANLSAVLLNLGAGIFLVLGILRRYGEAPRPGLAQDEREGELIRPRIAALVAATLFAVSHIMLVFGRVPFLENGLLFLCALTFLVTVSFKDSWWGALAAGALVPLCALAGKLFGALIIAPVFLTLFLCTEKRWRQVALATLGAITATVLWYWLIIGDAAAPYHKYLFEQSYGLYGKPPGLSSVKGFVGMMLSYGGEARVFRFHYVFPALLLGAALVLFTRNRTKGWRSQNVVLVFVAVWALAAWGGLAPFSYRPVRYATFALFPLIAFIALGAGELWGTVTSQMRAAVLPRKKLAQNIPFVDWLSLPILFVGVTIIIAHIRYAPMADTMVRDSIWDVIQSTFWLSVPATALAAALGPLLRKISLSAWRAVFLALLLGSVGVQGYWYWKMRHLVSHSLEVASRDLGDTTAPNAVFTGNYAPNLALDCGRRVIIYSFGLKFDDSALFKRYPITHMMVDEGNRVKAFEKYPEARSSMESGRWTFRDATVMAFRIGAGTDKARYTPTDFEVTQYWTERQNPDSGFLYSEKFLAKHPENLTALKDHIEWAVTVNLPDSALSMGARLLRDHPRDFSAFFLMQRVATFLGEIKRRPEYFRDAERYLEEAVRLNPAIEGKLRTMAAKTYRKSSG